MSLQFWIWYSQVVTRVDQLKAHKSTADDNDGQPTEKKGKGKKAKAKKVKAVSKEEAEEAEEEEGEKRGAADKPAQKAAAKAKSKGGRSKAASAGVEVKKRPAAPPENQESDGKEQMSTDEDSISPVSEAQELGEKKPKAKAKGKAKPKCKGTPKKKAAAKPKQKPEGKRTEDMAGRLLGHCC